MAFGIHVQKLDACSILINVSKCSAKYTRKLPRCNFRVSVFVYLISKVRIRITVSVSLRRTLRMTLMTFILRVSRQK